MAIFSSKDLPNVRPVADFNFAATKVLDNRINFSRGSGATYTDNMGVLRYASHNVPRFDHDPVTGESLGLLIEEPSTNYLTSTDAAVSWTTEPVERTTVANDTTAPDGSNTGIRFGGPTGRTQAYFYNFANSAVSSGKTTASWYVKAGTNRYIYLQVIAGNTSNRYAVLFDMDNDAAFVHDHTQGTVSGTSYAQQNVGNGWFRLSVTMDKSGSGNVYTLIGLSDDGNDTWANSCLKTISSSPSKYVYVWGPQVEDKPFASSFIPTNGTAVTRSEDRAVVKGEKFKKIFDTGFNSFSVLIDYDNLSTDDGDNYCIFAMWGEVADFDNRIELFKPSTSPNYLKTKADGNGNNVFVNTSLSASDKSEVQKIAFSWSVPDYSNTTSRRWAMSFSGEDVDEIADSTGTSTPALTRLGIGIRPTIHNLYAGLTHFKRVAIYNTVLTDEELKGLSAI